MGLGVPILKHFRVRLLILSSGNFAGQTKMPSSSLNWDQLENPRESLTRGLSCLVSVQYLWNLIMLGWSSCIRLSNT